MKEKTLSEKLKAEARALGLCDEWFSEWENNCSLDDLCKKYVCGIDFCLENRFPSNEIIEKEFDSIRRKYNIFVNEDVSFRNDSGSWAAILGESKAKVYLCDYGILEMVICDTATAKITLDDAAKCYVTLLDNAKIDVLVGKDAQLIVYTNHPENINYIKREGKAKVRSTIFMR